MVGYELDTMLRVVFAVCPVVIAWASLCCEKMRARRESAMGRCAFVEGKARLRK